MILLAGALLLPAQTPDATPDESSPLFDSTVLHQINLSMDPLDWQTLKDNYLTDTYYPAAFEWSGQVVANVAVRSRGNTSRSGVKPSLKLDFNQYVAKRTFLRQKALILLNMVQDAPMLRDYLSMQLFRRVGIAAPREAYARLSVNGEFQGLFPMVEDIDTPFLARNFPDKDGWLYEYKWTFPYNFEDLGADPATYVPALFEPKTNKNSPNSTTLVELIQAINNATPESFADDVSSRLDVDQFLRQLAVEVYLSDFDGLTGLVGLNNFYLYQPASEGSRFSFLPWDKSETLDWYDMPIYERFDQNVLVRQALQVPELKAAYLAHLREVAEAAGGEGGWLDLTAIHAILLTRESAREDLNKPYSDPEYAEAQMNALFDIWMRYYCVDKQLRDEGT